MHKVAALLVVVVVAGCSSSAAPSSDPDASACAAALAGQWQIVDTLIHADARCSSAAAGVFSVTIDREGWRETNDRGELVAFSLDGIADDLGGPVCAVFSATHVETTLEGLTVTTDRALLFDRDAQTLRGTTTTTIADGSGADLCRVTFSTEARR